MTQPGGSASDRPDAARAAVAPLVEAAARCTTAGVQQAVARLLGAPDEVADAAVAAVADAGLLGHGVALPALIAAARRGTDLPEAFAHLAAGERLPASWSDYEARAARDEALDEAVAALRGLGSGQGIAAAVGPGAPIAALRAAAGGAARAAVGAFSARPRQSPQLLEAVIEERWSRLLLAAAGLEVVSAPIDDPTDRWLQTALVAALGQGAAVSSPPPPELSGAGVAVHLEGVISRASDYLDPIEETAIRQHPGPSR